MTWFFHSVENFFPRCGKNGRVAVDFSTVWKIPPAWDKLFSTVWKRAGLDAGGMGGMVCR